MGEEVFTPTMYEQVVSLPEQIGEALDTKMEIPPATGKICICGMGASALAGDVISDYIDGSSKYPVYVVRGIGLPGWVGKNATVIILSYSGDTKETLTTYEEARSRGSNIICITSGGSLAQRCRSHKNIVVKVPKGYQSRGAFGYLMGYLALVLERMKVCSVASDFRKLIPELKRHRDKLVDNENTIVRDISGMLIHRVPVIYSLANMRSSAIRWKTQINENSKCISFCGAFPEFNHNEIMGWTANNENSIFMPVVLYDEDASKTMKHMTDTSIDILQDKQLKLVSYHVNGSSSLEKNLKCIILGDLVSLQLAKPGQANFDAERSRMNTESLVIIDD